MGTGSSAEKTANQFNNSVTTILTNTFVNISRQSSNVVSTSQTIDFSGITCYGKANFSGISQTATSTINTSVLSQTINQSTLQSTLESTLKQVSDSNQDVKSGFLAGPAKAADTTTTINNNIHDVASSYTYNDFQNDLQAINAAQKINFRGLTIYGDCNFSDISQNLVLYSLSSNISKKLTDTFYNMLNSANLNQESSANQTVTSNGPLEALGDMIGNIFGAWTGAIVSGIIAVIFLIFLVIIIIAIIRGGKSSQPQQLPPLQSQSSNYTRVY